VPWVSRSGLFGVEVVFEDASYSNRVSTIRRGLAEVEEVHSLLNTEPVVGFRLRDGAVQWLKGWAMALQKEAVKKKAVEKARRVKHCRL
jgi:DNA-binding winged helix-turn-helix (wHTH) protein